VDSLIKERLLRLDGVEGVGEAGQTLIVFVSKDNRDLYRQIKQIAGNTPVIIELVDRFSI
jgi:phosphotransferase system IIB component